jgi:hypothetical protein
MRRTEQNPLDWKAYCPPQAWGLQEAAEFDDET